MTQTDLATCVDAPPIEPVLVEFATGLAHDLSNALNSVGLHADMAKLMLDRGEVDSARRMLDGVQSEFRRNIHLMNALRRFATAPNSLSIAPIALPPLLQEARDCACLLLDANSDAIVIADASGVGNVEVDREAMVYVIVQIIRNALEAGATRIAIDAEGTANHWRLRLCDNGPGIDATLQSKLFGMFVSSRRDQGHLGLGLWVVDRLCSAQGFTVLAGPNPEGGAIFVLETTPATISTVG